MVAARLAAMMAFSAVKNGDRVGLVAFTDQVEKFVPPKKGRKHVLRIIDEILSFDPVGTGTSIGTALEFVGQRHETQGRGVPHLGLPRRELRAGRCT